MNTNSIIEELVSKLNTTNNLEANAAVVVLLRSTDRGIQVLLVKRAEKSTDPWSGQIALPGGKRNLKDSDLKHTVIRETLEETAINLLKNCRFLGTMEQFTSIQKPEMKIVPFIVIQEKKQKIKLNNELSDYFWIKLKKIIENKGTVKYKLEDFPAFIIGKYTIWGLTFKILQELLELLSFVKERN